MKPINSNALADGVTARVIVLFLFVGLMWVIHAIDAIKPTGTSMLSTGIVPRTWYGLKGFPLLHSFMKIGTTSLRTRCPS